MSAPHPDDPSATTPVDTAREPQATVAHGPGGETGSATQTPAQVPGYEVREELGRGGMGVVYKARQIRLDRIVALKMILAGSHAGSDALARFRVEAEALARLQHPNIVQVYEVGEHEGRPFFSLEFCDGGSLETKLSGNPLPASEAAALVETLARAMASAHASGVVHRDLKPANVLLAACGLAGDGAKPQAAVLKITDFGLAKKLDDASGQTQSGAIMGTPSYMAPEQASGKVEQLGPGCDVYALGAILYECLTGRPPFKAASVMDTLFQVIHDEPVAPTQLQSKTPRDLETICLKALRKDPERRYPSAAELADDLRRFQAGEPILARPVGRVERLAKWARRQPVVAGLLVGLFLALTGGASFSTYFAVQANQRANEEERQREFAEGQTQLAEQREQEKEKLTDELEVTLVDNLLRLVGRSPSGADPAEAEALEKLASLSADRVRLRFLERGLADPETAVRLGLVSDRVVQATVGINAQRRKEVERLLLARLNNERLDQRIREACVALGTTMGIKAPEFTATASGTLVNAILQTTDMAVLPVRVARWNALALLLDADLVDLQAESILKHLLDVAATLDEFKLPVLIHPLTTTAGRLAGKEANRVANVIGRRLADMMRDAKELSRCHRLCMGLKPLVGKLSAEVARDAFQAILKTMSNTFRVEWEYREFVELLILLEPRLGRDESAKLAVPVASLGIGAPEVWAHNRLRALLDRMIERLDGAGRAALARPFVDLTARPMPQHMTSRALALVRTLTHDRGPGETSALAASTIRNLATAALAARTEDTPAYLAQQCKALAPRLLPADAGPVVAHLLEVIGKVNAEHAVAAIGSMLATVAGTLDQERGRKCAGSAAHRIVLAIEKHPQAPGVFQLAVALKELSSLLDRDTARIAATRLLALLPRAADHNQFALLAGAIAGMRTGLDARETLDPVEQVVNRLTQLGETTAPLSLGPVLAALAGRLSPADALAQSRRLLELTAKLKNPRAQECLRTSLTGFWPRLDRDGAKAVTDLLPELVVKTSHLAGLRAFVQIAEAPPGLLDRAGTGKLEGALAERLTELMALPLNAYDLGRATDVLARLAAKLDRALAGKLAATAVQRLLEKLDTAAEYYMTNALAGGVVKLAPWLDRATRERSALALRDVLAKPGNNPRLLPVADSLAALAPLLDEGLARQHAVIAAERILDAMLTVPDGPALPPLTTAFPKQARLLDAPLAAKVAGHAIERLARAPSPGKAYHLGGAIVLLAERLDASSSAVVFARLNDQLWPALKPASLPCTMNALLALASRLPAAEADRQIERVLEKLSALMEQPLDGSANYPLLLALQHLTEKLDNARASQLLLKPVERMAGRLNPAAALPDEFLVVSWVTLADRLALEEAVRIARPLAKRALASLDPAGDPGSNLQAGNAVAALAPLLDGEEALTAARRLVALQTRLNNPNLIQGVRGVVGRLPVEQVALLADQLVEAASRLTPQSGVAPAYLADAHRALVARLDPAREAVAARSILRRLDSSTNVSAVAALSAMLVPMGPRLDLDTNRLAARCLIEQMRHSTDGNQLAGLEMALGPFLERLPREEAAQLAALAIERLEAVIDSQVDPDVWIVASIGRLASRAARTGRAGPPSPAYVRWLASTPERLFPNRIAELETLVPHVLERLEPDRRRALLEAIVHGIVRGVRLAEYGYDTTLDERLRPLAVRLDRDQAARVARELRESLAAAPVSQALLSLVRLLDVLADRLEPLTLSRLATTAAEAATRKLEGRPEGNELPSLARAAVLLARRLPQERARELVSAVHRHIDRELTTTSDAYSLSALAGALLVLTEHVDPAEGATRITRLFATQLAVMSSAVAPEERVRPVRLLGGIAERLTPAQAGSAVPVLLDMMEKSTWLDAHLACAEAVKALTPRLDAGPARLGQKARLAAVRRLVEVMTGLRNTEDQSRYLAPLRDLAADIVPDEAERLLRQLNTMIAGDIHPSNAARLGEAIAILVERYPASTAGLEAMRMLAGMLSRTRYVDGQRILVKALESLTEGLRGEQAGAAAGLLLDRFSSERQPDTRQFLAGVFEKLMPRLDARQAAVAARRILATKDPARLTFLANLLPALARHLDAALALQGTKQVAEWMAGSTGSETLSVLERAFQTLLARVENPQRPALAARLVELAGGGREPAALRALIRITVPLASKEDREKQARRIVAQVEKLDDPLACVTLSWALTDLVGDFDRETATRLCAPAARRLVERMEKTTDVDTLLVLSDIFTKEQGFSVDEAARRLAALLGQPGASDVFLALVRGLRPLLDQIAREEAGRLAAPIAARAVETLDTNAKAPIVAARAFALLAEMLPAKERANLAASVVSKLTREVARTADAAALRQLTAALALVASSVPKGDAHWLTEPVARLHTEALQKSQRLPATLAELTDAFDALAREVDTARVGEPAARVARQLATEASRDTPLRVPEAFPGLTATLGTPRLIELLQSPHCVGPLRPVVLQQLGRRAGQRFGSMLEFEDWLRRQHRREY